MQSVADTRRKNPVSKGGGASLTRKFGNLLAKRKKKYSGVMKSAELLAHDQLQFALDNDTDCFTKAKAELYGVTAQEQFVKIAWALDVYDLLDSSYNFENFVGISVHTTGWCAPLNADGDIDCAPSDHPERRRVSLITTITDEGRGSALAFTDEEEVITDPGTASGSLADAIAECWLRSKL
jgi:hypothetical protein